MELKDLKKVIDTLISLEQKYKTTAIINCWGRVTEVKIEVVPFDYHKHIQKQSIEDLINQTP